MNDDRLLIRHLHGELSGEETVALERRLREEPELARDLLTSPNRCRAGFDFSGLWGLAASPAGCGLVYGRGARLYTRTNQGATR